MRVVNLLEFLNKTNDLFTLSYAQCETPLINFLDLIDEDEQFIQKFDYGVVYLHQKSFDQCTIVDGLNRIVSLSLLLHAICECYKKTSPQNDKAISVIRSKYLLNGTKPKIKLPEKDAIVYNKIINGERLSGHEKQSPLFVLLHKFWTQIKEENLQASTIFSILKKVYVTVVDTGTLTKRDLYYKLNENRNLNQILLIDDFMQESGIISDWEEIKQSFSTEKDDIYLFLRDFFITKFNYKNFYQNRLYTSFINYFSTMSQYMAPNLIISHMKRSAKLYNDILDVNFENENIKQAFVKIKKSSGDDTYAYILEVYEDFTENNISETTFIEILNTIAEYCKNRKINNNKMAFNELIQYLNTFITCK